MSLDNELLFAAMALEVLVLGLLVYRRVWRNLPIFCIYLLWGLLSDGLGYMANAHFAGLTSNSYLRTYFIFSGVDSTLQFCVMVELGWAVLRPLRDTLSKRALLLVFLIILIAGAAIWPLASVEGLARYPVAWQNLIHLQRTTSILRVLFFLTLAASSQLLSIGWKDRELQVATGLGLYSMVSLAVDLLRGHVATGPKYNALNRVVVASYLCSLLYWGYSFAHKEQARQAFTPQMQSFLLAVAGTARSTRVSLSDDQVDPLGKHRR